MYIYYICMYICVYILYIYYIHIYIYICLEHNKSKYYEEVPLLLFQGSPGVPLLNFVEGPGSRDPDTTFTPCQVC